MTATNGRAREPLDYTPGSSRSGPGRLASEVSQEEVDWIAEGLIPSRCLSLIVGQPSSGKSTFGAWLCQQARAPAILPGSEESLGAALIPRLVKAGVNLGRCLILDGRSWVMPDDRGYLVGALQSHAADLLWIDPIDFLLGEQNENDGPAVRACLEALHAVSQAAGVTIVAARHPGKQPENVCPGSRQWRAVPRTILRMDVDRGPPERRFLSTLKPYGGNRPAPREYSIEGKPREPGRFVLGDEVSEAEALAGEISDRIDRRKVDEAEKLLAGLLGEKEQLSKVVYAAAEEERLGDRIVRRAAERLGVIVRRDGRGRDHKSYWSLPLRNSGHETHTPTPDTETHTPPPVCVPPVRSQPVSRKSRGKKDKKDGKKTN